MINQNPQELYEHGSNILVTEEDINRITCSFYIGVDELGVTNHSDCLVYVVDQLHVLREKLATLQNVLDGKSIVNWNNEAECIEITPMTEAQQSRFTQMLKIVEMPDASPEFNYLNI